MLSTALENLLRGADSNAITELFIWMTIGCLALGLVLQKKGVARGFVEFTPALLTSLGILGTFVGIVVGLLDFKPDDIDGSIGTLLEGLKTAFITSLAGMSASITFKMLSASGYFDAPEQLESVDDVGAEDIYRAINEQGHLLLESSKQQLTMLASLKRAIAGSEDDALVSQIKLLKSDLKDRLDKSLELNQQGLQSFDKALVVIQNQPAVFQAFETSLWERLQNVADMISKSATEQVINALKEVIVDFNNNLIEQFGDNFKALDESVKKLVTWQENYSHQLEQMIEQYKQGVQAITQTEVSVAHISEKSAYIPETMNNLKRVMEVNQHQVDELERHLEAFKAMRDKAVEAVPEIRKQVEETVTEIAKSVTTASEHYNSLLVESDKYIKQHVEKSNEMLDKFVSNTKEGIEAVKTGLISGTDVIGKDLRSSSEEVKKAIAEGAENFVKASLGSNESLQKTANELERQSGVITKQLEDTVTDINGNIRDMINKIIEESKTIGTTLKETNTHLNADIKKVQEQVAGNIDQMQNRLESALSEVFNQQTKEIKRVFDALDDEVKSTVGLTGEAVNKQVAMIDKSMEQEIEKVMRTMGNALAMISRQFTNDYTKLVEAMSAVVNQQIRR